MKERPILFSAPMVRAILAGTKTQTRRIVKPQPAMLNEGWPYAKNAKASRPGWDTQYDPMPCPYGEPGDRLWVKETWFTPEAWDSIKPTELPILDLASGIGVQINYAADLPEDAVILGRLRPSIFMRRWMSRITLEIVSVRVERLQDISAADAIAEGIEITRASQLCGITYRDYSQARRDPFEDFTSPVDSYRTLWESINGPSSWAANPWLWVVEFRRVQQ